VGEIASQIGLTRASLETRGAIYFSFKSLRNDLGGIQKELSDRVYERNAVIPRFSWIRTGRVQAPKVNIRRDREFVRISWTERGSRRAFWFVVYARDRNGWSWSVLPASQRSIALSAERGIRQVVVKAVDRLGNESP
jgi:hypothetical protein